MKNLLPHTSRNRCRLCLLAALTLAPALQAQTSAPPPQKAPTLAYDVAVIKPSKATNFNTSINTDNDVLQATNVSMLELLPFACDVRKRQITGLPPWADHQRFDINAKILDATPDQVKNLSQAQTRALLLGLLEQRFGLKWHNVDEMMPAYELTVSKAGSKLKPAKGSEDNRGIGVNNTEINATGISMADLAATLSDQADRPVVDRTGLTGRYDLELKWSREEPKADAASNGTDADAPPPLFIAIEEQLGLRLVPGKDPVRKLVVDQLTEPSEN